MRVHARLQALLLSPLGILLVAALIIPALILFSYSLYAWIALEPHGTLTLKNYLGAIGGRLYQQVALTTLLVAAPTTIMSVVGGYLIAYYAIFVQRRGRSLMFALIVSAVMASYLARIFAWRTLLGETGLINSVLTGVGLIREPLQVLLFSRPSAIFAMTALFMPLAALTFYAALGGISSDYREAARDLGAGRAQALLRITLPLSGPSVLATSALIFFLACGDYVTPVLVGGIDTVTIGRLISDNFGTIGNYGQGAALSFLMLVGFAIAYFVFRTAMRLTGLLPENTVADSYRR
jgi:ABC-type spermidine/putrescine transport system, permease component I